MEKEETTLLEDDTGEGEEGQTSSYNEASFQIQRLHTLWLTAEMHAQTNNYVGWCSVLDGVERELYSDIEKLDYYKKAMATLTALKKTIC